MHNNKRYFDSFHCRNFQFYSQLIERYRDYLNEQETTYLFGTSSYTERNNETSIFNRNVNEEKKKSRNTEQIYLKENTYNHFSNQENLTEECPIHSNHLAQPQEEYLQKEENEPFNLHGETICRPRPFSFSRHNWNNFYKYQFSVQSLNQILLKQNQGSVTNDKLNSNKKKTTSNRLEVFWRKFLKKRKKRESKETNTTSKEVDEKSTISNSTNNEQIYLLMNIQQHLNNQWNLQEKYLIHSNPTAQPKKRTLMKMETNHLTYTVKGVLGTHPYGRSWVNYPAGVLSK
jgi:hypothetical protein